MKGLWSLVWICLAVSGCQELPCVSAPRHLALPSVPFDSREAVAFSFLDRDGQSRTALDRDRIPPAARVGVTVEWGIPARRPPMPLSQIADLSGGGPFVAVTSGGGQGRSAAFAGYRGGWLAKRLKTRLQIAAEEMEESEDLVRTQVALLWNGKVPKDELGLLPQTLDHHRRLRWIEAQMPIRRAFLPSLSSPSAVLLVQKGCEPCEALQRAMVQGGCASMIAVDVGSDRGQALIAYLTKLFGEEAVTVPALFHSGEVFFGLDVDRLASQVRVCPR